jgi:hypothetical protein
MKTKVINSSKIAGNLDIFVKHNEDEFEGEISKWDEILIHGDPSGLKSFANLLIDIANLNQDKIEDKHLPIGAREHVKLRPGLELSKSSNEVIVGRLDAKKTGKFYDSFIPKNTLETD